MNTSTTTDELKKLMRIPANACNIEDIFDKIANILKNECVIKYEGNEYRILDFEFYYYNKNHQDISVHPRNSEALCWYINDFGGIDLNFESKIKRSPFSFKYELTDNSYFGGILLRQIQCISNDDKRIYDSPLKVAELFRILDATSQKQNNPILETRPLDTEIEFQEPLIRHNLLGSHIDNPKAKADYNLRECFVDVPEPKKRKLEEELKFYSKKKYRYCYKRCPNSKGPKSY